MTTLLTSNTHISAILSSTDWSSVRLQQITRTAGWLHTNTKLARQCFGRTADQSWARRCRIRGEGQVGSIQNSAEAPSKLTQTATLPPFIWEIWISAGKEDILTAGLRGFLQSPYTISGIIPQVWSRPRPSISFPIYYSLIILTFDAIYPEPGIKNMLAWSPETFWLPTNFPLGVPEVSFGVWQSVLVTRIAGETPSSIQTTYDVHNY
jgi:hypothetical protein